MLSYLASWYLYLLVNGVKYQNIIGGHLPCAKQKGNDYNYDKKLRAKYNDWISKNKKNWLYERDIKKCNSIPEKKQIQRI